MDQSTEQKIKEAARTIFMKKGYAGTKTRDIAEEAGINLALLNYYFRSKEKLFQQIMMESLINFFSNIRSVFFDTSTNLEQKIIALTSNYIEMFKAQPDIPMFILNELNSNPEKFISMVSANMKPKESVLFQQLIAEIGEDRIRELNPVHILINTLSMIAFPFVGNPIFKYMGDLNDAQFNTLMDERKRLIPIWIMQMLK